MSPSHHTEYGGHGQQQGQTAVRGPPTGELQAASDRPVSSLCFSGFLRLRRVLVHASAHENLKQRMGDNCEGRVYKKKKSSFNFRPDKNEEAVMTQTFAPMKHLSSAWSCTCSQLFSLCGCQVTCLRDLTPTQHGELHNLTLHSWSTVHMLMMWDTPACCTTSAQPCPASLRHQNAALKKMTTSNDPWPQKSSLKSS